jgi:hypothetical protein
MNIRLPLTNIPEAPPDPVHPDTELKKYSAVTRNAGSAIAGSVRKLTDRPQNDRKCMWMRFEFKTPFNQRFAIKIHMKRPVRFDHKGVELAV